jgi:RimJ/RimL family protein N-acetyltransferase
MFPDIARDDVFRLETAQLWLRWPRAKDAPAIDRYSSRWEVAQFTAHIPHPYPQGTAERFVFATRAANANGRDLNLVIETRVGKRCVVGAIGLSGRGVDRLALGYALSPEVWGRGYATEAVEAMVETAFRLTHCVEINVDVRVENPASRRVLDKCGFAYLSTGPQGAPARGGMVQCDRLQLKRPDWAARRTTEAGSAEAISETAR